MDNEEVKTKKRVGRRPKNQKVEYVINKDKCKFIVDFSSEKESADLIFGLLEKANKKEYGREVIFKDLAIFALARLTDKDLERIQEMSFSEMEKVDRTLKEFNTKHGLNLTLGEFLVKKLNIN